MILPFEDNPFIKEYVEIKRYFRRFESQTSKERIRDFYRFAKILKQLGYEVAFDFVGSLNFGITEHNSDVDFILYIWCDEHVHQECTIFNCNNYRQVYFLILHTLMQNYIKPQYQAQIVDYINLKKLEKELNKESEHDHNILFRFAFYRSISRGVNLKILRPYQKKLLSKPELLKTLSKYIDDVIFTFNQSSKHNLSFEKYRIRLHENGIKIPDSIIKKIKNYLNFSSNYLG
ncbi:MAG: hypothetical protein NZ853_11280 [Leptospiraceae bacterium]|nr:hypothetical protein [Leptospiraceae bacterium]MDW7975461.1 hypothetical protein [Leptospiraceae bacterium]